MIDYRKMFSPKKVEEIHHWMRNIAQKKSIKKIAHQVKFEENWTRKILEFVLKGGFGVQCTQPTFWMKDQNMLV